MENRKYNFKEIEKKWQDKWEKEGIYRVDLDKAEKPFYNLMMFPYPSAEGLHVGNMYAFTHSDAYGRFMRLKGYDVFEPIGLDGFGIHSENYAIKIGEHIKTVSARTEKHFYQQFHMIGNAYDWSRKVETYDPNYYKWTQWLFLKMYEKGLAYRKSASVNWCPSCKTVLSDEQVIGGECERCGSQVEKKQMEQWFFRITDYADKLLNNLDWLDWTEEVKTIQRNWIGRSEGAIIQFKITNYELRIPVFTTRPDTLFGCTLLVVSPEHEFISKIKNQIANISEVEKYIEESKKKSDLERTDLNKDKMGVRLEGVSAINPANGEEIPIFVADYVLSGYGTGAIMAVPAHDERDNEFAKKYNLSIKEVVAPYLKDNPREDKKTEKRDVVTAIVKNSKNNKYLCLDWKTTEWKSFPTGGIDGQDLIEAAKREIAEETGYVNIEFVKQLGGSVYAEFYRPHKDSNVFAHFRYLLFELENEEQIKVLEKEKKQHEAIWIEEDKVNSYINVWNQKLIWKMYLEGDFTYTGSGVLINSGDFTGLKSEEAKEKIVEWLEENKIGERKINYKLRDWCVSRQRYWGPPIPMIYCEKCGWVPVPERDLPVELPDMDDFLPDGSGKGPLNKVESFVNTVCPVCGGSAKRETDVSDPFVDSCWYYMRYPNSEFFDKAMDKDRLKKWMPVDMYIGGKEHSVLHLLYARFVTMVMYEFGIAPEEEPFKCFRAHGLLIKDGAKMSKSKGNVINPDEYIAKYGADSMRMYLMFLGDMRQGGDWRDDGISGMHRFIKRIYNLSSKFKVQPVSPSAIRGGSSNAGYDVFPRLLHKTIKKVTEDLDNFKFNTAISAMMILVNEMEKQSGVSQDDFGKFLILLSPFAPHLAEELWSSFAKATDDAVSASVKAISNKYKESIFKQKWPEYDPELIKEEEIEIPVQINGKVRDTIKMSIDVSEEEVKKTALESEKVKKWLDNKAPRKIIYIKDKMISIVV